MKKNLMYELVCIFGLIFGKYKIGIFKDADKPAYLKEQKIVDNIIISGIHAFFINKGFEGVILYSEVEKIYQQTKSETETVYLLTLKYTIPCQTK